MQASAWMSIAWHTVMPCAVFTVAYARIFLTVRRLLKVRQRAPPPPPAGAAIEPSRDTEVENAGRNDAAPVDRQSGPTRPGSPIPVLAGVDVEQQSGPASDAAGKISRTELNVLNTVVMVILLQLVCWLPTKIYVICQSFGVGL